MKTKKHWFGMTALALMFAIGSAGAKESQVLVTVGNLQVTADELKSAMGSSPFATQSVALGEDDQASLRGDLLRRLVAARLLMLEAKRLGLDKTAGNVKDIEDFRNGLLYRFYMDKLRERVAIPEATLSAMKQQFKNDADGLAAARSAYTTDQYRAMRLLTLQNLQKQDNVRLFESRINPAIKADTVLMEGNSFSIKYADIVNSREYPTLPNPEWVKEQLYKRGELLLVAHVAEREGVDVSAKVRQYQSERLPDLMMEKKAHEWIPNEKTLRNWFKQHPEVAVVTERRHVGQLVLATRPEAEAMRARILKGESLFTLAGEYSVDAEGKAKNGDMGWITAGRGLPELDKALARLPDGQVSEIVQTPVGFHLLTIIERKPGQHKTFADVRERVRQLIINEKLPPYLGTLEHRYKVNWQVLQGREEAKSVDALNTAKSVAK
ncbi:MAG: peptidylprolyl isomerase [Proteobacteria bacterium]|nr:peptidylprolyl isomerase [Pseudomonadota bacterium]